METRIWPGLIAILFGSMTLVVILLPLIAQNYRRFGRLTPSRIVAWGAFTVYVIALGTYTMLPLPSDTHYECVSPRLSPGASLSDIAEYDTSSFAALAANPGLWQILFNVLLFAPLGVFMRLLWGRGVVATTLLGSCISILIETTQLTGLWGIYPCAYRLFDIDDIITNTLGALLGALLALAFRLRPIAPSGPLGPRPVTFWRRLLGMLGDVFVSSFLATVGSIGWAVFLSSTRVANGEAGARASELQGAGSALAETTAGLAFALAVQLVLVLCTGRTIGDFIVNVRYEAASAPWLLARSLRFLGGIGGYLLLTAPQLEVAGLGWLAPGYALTLAIWALATRDRSGLAGRLSGQRVVDAFRPDPRVTSS